MLGKEPTLILGMIQAVAQAVQAIVLPWGGSVNTSEHVVLAIIIASVSAVLNRAVVSPAI